VSLASVSQKGDYLTIQKEGSLVILKRKGDDWQKLAETERLRIEEGEVLVTRNYEQKITEIVVLDSNNQFVGSVSFNSIIQADKEKEIARKIFEATNEGKIVEFPEETLPQELIIQTVQPADSNSIAQLEDIDNISNISDVLIIKDYNKNTIYAPVKAKIEGVGESRVNIPVSYNEEKNAYNFLIEEGAVFSASTQGVLKHQGEQRNVEIAFGVIYEGDSFRLKSDSEFWAFYKKSDSEFRTFYEKEGIDFGIKVVPEEEEGYFVPYLKDLQLSPQEAADNLADAFYLSLPDYISWKITARLLPDDEPTQLEMVASHQDSKVKIALSPNKDLSLSQIEAEIINKFEKFSACSSEDEVISHFSPLADEKFALSLLEFPGFDEEGIESKVEVRYTSKEDWYAIKKTEKEIEPDFDKGILPGIEITTKQWNKEGIIKEESVIYEGEIIGEQSVEGGKIRLVRINYPEKITYAVYFDNQLRETYSNSDNTHIQVELIKGEEGKVEVRLREIELEEGEFVKDGMIWKESSLSSAPTNCQTISSPSPEYKGEEDLGMPSIELKTPYIEYRDKVDSRVIKEAIIEINIVEEIVEGRVERRAELKVVSVRGENGKQKFVQIGDTVFTTEEDIYKYPEFHHQEGLLQRLFGWTGENLLSAPSTPGYLSVVKVTNGKDTAVIFRPSQESEIEEEMRIFRILKREDPVKAAILADFLIKSSFWILQDKKYLEELESYRNTPEYELAIQTREYQMLYSSMEKAASATKFRKTIFFIYPLWRISNGEDSWQDWEDFVNRIPLPSEKDFDINRISLSSEELGIVYHPQEQGYTVLDVGFDVITAVDLVICGINVFSGPADEIATTAALQSARQSVKQALRPSIRTSLRRAFWGPTKDELRLIAEHQAQQTARLSVKEGIKLSLRRLPAETLIGGGVYLGVDETSSYIINGRPLSWDEGIKSFKEGALVAAGLRLGVTGTASAMRASTKLSWVADKVNKFSNKAANYRTKPFFSRAFAGKVFYQI
ncbi:MAG: hypothetical protein DRN95_06645, partial [Candidatus Hydrothermarchaeota archaeon]